MKDDRITAGVGTCHADGEADGNREEAEQQQVHRMLLVVVAQRAQHYTHRVIKSCQLGHKFEEIRLIQSQKKNRTESELNPTDEGQEEEEDVEGESGVGGDEELRDAADLDDEGRHGRRHRELHGEDDVDLVDERPPQVGALHHPRVQRLRRAAGLEIMPLPEHGFPLPLASRDWLR